MRESSAIAAFHESQNHKASLRAAFAAREEKIRIALRVHLTLGVKERVAEDAGVRPDQLSRMLSGENRIAEIVVEVALFHLRGSCGHRALTEALQLLRTGRIEDFKEHKCTAEVVQYPGGKTVVGFE